MAELQGRKSRFALAGHLDDTSNGTEKVMIALKEVKTTLVKGETTTTSYTTVSPVVFDDRCIWDKFWPSILYGNYKRAENRASPDANPKPVEFYSLEALANGLLLPDGTLQEMAIPTFLLRKAGVRIVDPEAECPRALGLVRPWSLKFFHLLQTLDPETYVSRETLYRIDRILCPMLFCVLLRLCLSGSIMYFGDFADFVVRIAFFICFFYLAF